MKKIIITLLSLMTILPQAFAAEEEFHTGLQVDTVWMEGTHIDGHVVVVHITFSNPNDTIAYSDDGIRIYVKQNDKIWIDDLDTGDPYISVDPHSQKEMTMYAFPLSLSVGGTWVIGTGYWINEATNEDIHDNPREIFCEIDPKIEEFRVCDISVNTTISNSFEKDGKLCTNDNNVVLSFDVTNNEDFTFIPASRLFCKLEEMNGKKSKQIEEWYIMPKWLEAGENVKGSTPERSLEYGKEYRIRIMYPTWELALDQYCVDLNDPIYFDVVDPAVDAINSVASPDVPVTVYTTDGKLVMRGMMENTEALPKGMYVFKQEEKVWKVSK